MKELVKKFSYWLALKTGVKETLKEEVSKEQKKAKELEELQKEYEERFVKEVPILEEMFKKKDKCGGYYHLQHENYLYKSIFKARENTLAPLKKIVKDEIKILEKELVRIDNLIVFVNPSNPFHETNVRLNYKDINTELKMVKFKYNR